MSSHAQQSLPWTMNGQIHNKSRPQHGHMITHSQRISPSKHPQRNVPFLQFSPLVDIFFSGPLNGTDSPPKLFNTAAKQFGNITPVTNGNGGSLLFSSTPSTNFNRNKFAPNFFTPRNSTPGIASSDIDGSSAGESPLPDDSPDVPPRRPQQTQYEKIRGARKFQDAIRRKRIQKPRRSYITGTSKYDSDSDDASQTHEGDVFALTTTDNTSTNKNDKNHKVSTWTADPDLPYVASGYVQLVFNMFLVGVALYIGLAFIRTIQRDVDQKVEEYSAGTALVPKLGLLTLEKYCRRWQCAQKSTWRIVVHQIHASQQWRRPA